MNYESVLQLNKYPTDRYNVLVPVTTMQAASNLQRIVVSEVQLDTRQDNTNRGPARTSILKSPAARLRSRRWAA